VVDRVNENGVPTSDESRTYIGLEHFDADSFTIVRWGSEVDLVVPKTCIKKGDVLFARRNTHLKRCAVAPFDTYFSPDGYAFRTKSPALLQDLLLYIVASDNFMNFAIEHSAGTHSKRVKWDDLVRYEFVLPPMEEQRGIADVLHKAELVEKMLHTCRETVQTLRVSLTETIFAERQGDDSGHNPGVLARGWRVEQLGNIADVRFSNVDKKTKVEEIPVRLCNYMDVYTKDYITNSGNFMCASASNREIDRFAIMKGDVLITKDSEEPTDIGVPALVIEELENVLCGYHLAMIRPDRNLIDSRYLWHFLKTRSIKRYLFQMANGVTRFGLPTGAILRLPVILPSLREQQELSRQLSMCRDSFALLSERVSVAVAIKRKLVDMFLCPIQGKAG
jgi:type I restriction enzyme S subunit